MAMKYVILGYLSWQPMSGTDIKRILADAETLPWSANDNRIYKALVELHREGWVNKMDGTHPRAVRQPVYAVTPAGKNALKKWLTTSPEPPFAGKSFLNQLLWADVLEPAALDELLDAYLNEVGGKLFFLRVQADQKPNEPQRTARESYLWEMIYKNWIAHYEIELKWVRLMRQELAEMAAVEKRPLLRQR